MSEIDKILNKDGDTKPKTPADESAEINNLKTTVEKTEQEKRDALAKVADLEFSAAFDKLASLYPHATEYRDQIKTKVATGYSVDDAVISVLTKEKKFVTADEIRLNENRGRDLGGSTPNLDLDNAHKGEKTLAELEKDFRDAEARGEIKIS